MSMLLPLIVLLALTLALVLLVALRPDTTRTTAGKAVAFVAIFLLPTLGLAMGLNEHMDHAKKREFCLSCHVMKPYGQSLHIDDEEYVPAGHFQNNRIPRDKACYTCHTTYAMFGDIQSKLRGVRHLQVQYFGAIPDTIELYEPYNNRECLHCHDGGRSFLAPSAHYETDTTMTAMMANRMSCMTIGCHDAIHDVHDLEDMDMWKEGQK